LNAVCPYGFENDFIDEDFIVDRELGFASKEPVYLVER
jgi:hypothetical protein